ncbi:MAG: DUF1684 domain-containing protein [Phycisphaerae bacterium]|nr:DUF1684 domain-containing protein [Phycisphaerae bacterium]
MNANDPPTRHSCRAAGVIAAGTLATLGGCHGGGGVNPGGEAMTRSVETAYESTVDSWHEERLHRLTADDGWLTLVGLVWLDEGSHDVGRDATCHVRADGFPAALVGTIERTGGVVRFRTAPAVPVDGVPDGGILQTDAGGNPTIVSAGTCRFHVIERGGRLAVRVKDNAAELRTAFAGIERYPVDGAWRIEAAFEPAVATQVPVTLITGSVSDEDIAGHAIFDFAGHAARLVLMPGSGDDRFFVVFGDATNGETTYGGGRFLEAVRDDDRVILDFNRAYNPPCSFTPYATCPRPGPDNVLPYAVTAGERAWRNAGGGH